VIHEVGNIGLEDRCNGIKDTFQGTVENVQVDIANVADAGNTIKSKLLSDASVDAVVTLNAQVAMAAVQAAADAGSAAKVGTFDLSQDALQAIVDGKLVFAVDQQEYLQGYIPVVLLELYIANGNTLGGGQPVLTGPSFVTKDNAAQVLEWAKAGTR
jgi:simple sugar transport system substrate-binding protein